MCFAEMQSLRQWMLELITQINLPHTQRNHRLIGLVLFDYGPCRTNPHARLILKQPQPVDPLHFCIRTLHTLAHSPGVSSIGDFDPLAPGESVIIQPVGPSKRNLARVINDDTKELKFNPDAYQDWKFTDDLSRLTGRGLAILDISWDATRPEILEPKTSKMEGWVM